MRDGGLSLPLTGAVSAVLWLALMVAESVRRAGVYEYPLDDVYIHLAMASGIAGGTYGVNPGEPASAASSILYPFLLLPFPGTAVQQMLPLFWNAAAAAAGGALWGRGLEAARLGPGAGLAAAVIGPLALNVSGVAFTGMEHGLQVALALAAVLGLWRWLSAGQAAGWWLAVLIVAPLVRYEALALSLACAGVLALTGRMRLGLAIAVLSVLPVAGFSLYLTALGLDPLPSSVLSKLAPAEAGTGRFEALLARMGDNLKVPSGWMLLILAAALGLRAAVPGGERAARLLLAVTSVVALANFALGRVGWMSRYEPHVIAMLALALVLAWGRAGGRQGPGLVLAITLAGGVYSFGWYLWDIYLGNPSAIHRQQAQMARLTHDFATGPVAVNDLGRVVWNAPDYVLDLWGLAYQPARRMRADPVAPVGWAGEMARRKGVRLAMVYDQWFGPALGADWVKLGQLRMAEDALYVTGAYSVAFYATDPAYAEDLRAAIAAWVPGLPEGSVWEPQP